MGGLQGPLAKARIASSGVIGFPLHDLRVDLDEPWAFDEDYS
jgi:hypothetical protein